jgi:hypothetical protein
LESPKAEHLYFNLEIQDRYGHGKVMIFMSNGFDEYEQLGDSFPDVT